MAMNPDALKPLAIFKQSSKLSMTYVVGYGLAFVANIATARVLGAELVGVLAVVGVWMFYLRLLQPGLLNALSREMPHLLGQGDVAGARRLQNVALTGELIFAGVPLLVLFLAGWTTSHSLIRIGLWLSMAAFSITAMQHALMVPLYARQRFDLIVRITVAVSVLQPLGVLVSLPWLGIYSPWLMPSVAGIIALGILWRHREVVQYRPMLERATARQLIRVGLPLTALGFFQWGYLATDRAAMLAAGVPLAMFGMYALASNVVRALAQVFWDFTSVLQPILWKSLGQHGSVRGISREVTSLWLVYTAMGCVAVTLAQVGFGALVGWWLPTFAQAVPVFEILVFLLVFQNSTQLPTLLLNSTLLNRQHVSLLLWGGALAVNAAAIFAAARAGLGLEAIAATSIGVDVVVAGASYVVTHRSLFNNPHAAWRFYGGLLGLAAVTLGLYLVFQWRPLAYEPTRAVWESLVRRALLALAVWAAVAVVVWRRWVRTGDTVGEPSVIQAAPAVAQELVRM
jgi:O-antigen/teichoic acid export membrane protein